MFILYDTQKVVNQVTYHIRVGILKAYNEGHSTFLPHNIAPVDLTGAIVLECEFRLRQCSFHFQP